MSDGQMSEPHVRLKGWKRIAAYFERDESTVRRWASEKGLPVHRVSGKSRGAVYAYDIELDAWLKSHGEIAPANAPRSAMQARPRTLPKHAAGLLAAAFGVAALLAAGAVWVQASHRGEPPAGTGHSHPSEAARTLYGEGMYLFHKRSPDSLPLAADYLERAVKADPDSALAWSALASAYNVMVEYRVIDVEDGYRRSMAAAKRAVALDPSLASAQSVLADLEFFWLKDFRAGLARFEEAVHLNPDDAQTRHWYASALALSGEPSKAMVEIGWARYLDPASRSIQVSEAIVLLAAGHMQAAEMRLRQVIGHEPNYANPYRFLSFARLAAQDHAGYLDALETRFRLRNDAAGLTVVRQGRAGLAASGRDGMAAAMLAAVRSDAERDALEPYFAAHVFALAGECAVAAERLNAVATRHAFYRAIDPAFAPSGEAGCDAAAERLVR